MGGLQNHVELHVAAMHPDRMSPIKHIRNLSPSAEFVCETKSAVRYFLEESSLKKIVFSAEGLSYLRLPCELEMLKSILGVDQVKIIVVLRSKMDFLRSYSEQLRKMGFSPSNERGSFLYVEPDSWLVDYASLIGAYQDTFGKENVIVKSYSEELERYGSIIPSLLNILGVPSYIFSRDKDLWLNRSTG